MIYLDYQATTPLAPEARAAMLPWLDHVGNPHSPHRLGREAKAAVELAREQVAEALICGPLDYADFPEQLKQEWRQPDSVGGQAETLARYRSVERANGQLFFTSGATEAANWAIKGSWSRRPPNRRRIVTLATEHACVLDSVASLEKAGCEVVVIPVDRAGMADADMISSAVNESTLLVVAALVNNEIGTIQNVAAIGARARAVGAL